MFTSFEVHLRKVKVHSGACRGMDSDAAIKLIGVSVVTTSIATIAADLTVNVPCRIVVVPTTNE